MTTPAKTDEDLFAFGQELGYALIDAIIEGEGEIRILKLLSILDSTTEESGPLSEVVALAGVLNAFSNVIKNQAELLHREYVQPENITFH